MLIWEKLLCPTRRKELYGTGKSMGTGIGRTECERDYDRILFATPTRRLADKTQVFPLEENDSIRNRLTHSHEVSNLARSIGVKLSFDHAGKVFGLNHEALLVKRNVPSLLAAVGLAHDLGNPPFGHQGEKAIQEWFKEKGEKEKDEREKDEREKDEREKDEKGEKEKEKEKDEIHIDFLKFDGNAQTFRLLTRLQVLNDQYGVNLTLGTLAGLLKYPSVYGSANKGGFKKHGVFKSEELIVRDVWKHTGLAEGIRHPLAYIMEACDDIAYSIIDAEDTVKKGYASFYDLMDYLISSDSKDAVIKDVVRESRKKNNNFKKDSLSFCELNEVSMQMFRVKAISVMVEAATDVFVNKIDKIMDGSIGPGFELIDNSACSRLCKAAKEFDYCYGFQHKEVLHLELVGNNYIKSMMSMLWEAISKNEDQRSPFERYVFGGISENYRRVYSKSDRTIYSKHQLLCDSISGMTEKYLMKTHDELKMLENEFS